MKTSIIQKFGLAACALTLAATTALAELPDKFVRYVEATGSQYIDTGIVGRYGTKAECKVAWMGLGDTAFLACGNYNNNTRFYMCYSSSNAGNMFTAQRTGDKVHSNESGHDLLFDKKRIYTYTSDFSAPYSDGTSTNTITIDGTVVFKVGKQSLDTGANLYIFACNREGSAISFSKTRFDGLQIWQDGSLVRDFKPCVHDGRAGLYDAKNDQIYYSGSGTDLIYDKNCDVPDAFIDYVESFGNSYIDTGVIGRPGTGAKMEMAWIGTSSDQALLDSRDGTNKRFYLVHRNTGDKWLWGYGSYGTFGSFTPGARCYIDASFAVWDQSITVRDGGPDGTVVGNYSGTSGTSIDTGRSMYLFCCNQSGGTLAKQYWGKARVYWLQIFQDGDMVRDFRPCLKYGEAALYDDISKTIFYPEGDPLGYDNSVAADPDEVAYVDYIESDGFTFLDTQVNAQAPTRATGTFSWSELKTADEEKNYLWTSGDPHRSYLACGYWNSSSDANRFYMIDETGQKPWVGYGNNTRSFGSAFVAGTEYDFDVSFAAGAHSVSFAPKSGSTSATSAEWSEEATGNGNLYLFACNDAKNKKAIYCSAAKCYGLTIWQGETKIREFKPCVKDGQAALYDTVSGRIFYPIPAIPAQGNTGAVKEESMMQPIDAYLEYVESDGTLYVDTGVIGKSGTAAEFIETSLCAKDSDSECFLGAKGSDANSRYFLWYHRNHFSLGLGYSGEFWTPSRNDPTAKVSDWNPATNPDAYGLPNGATNHVRVTFSEGSQKIVLIDDDRGARTTICDQTISGDVNTSQNLYVFAYNNNGTPNDFGKSRLYWLKLKQNGSLVRKFQPVRLKNSLVGLWDFVEGKAYLPKTSTGGFAQFSAIGDETDKLPEEVPFTIVVR